MGFGIEIVETCVTLSTVDVIAYEFFEDVGNCGVVCYFVDESDDVYCIKSL